jgi:phosphatidylglycerol:prolipoprotein diacylglycerol transferase
MIPYIHIPDLKLGPVTLHPFGLLVATGVIIGTAITTRRARNRGIDLDRLNSFITWMLVAGFIGGHMLDEIFYHPAEIVRRPYSLFMLWEGLSSFGGFVGGMIGVFLWKYLDLAPVAHVGPFAISWFKARPKPLPILPFCDLVLSVFPVAWIFGRSGCSVVHDHPGARAPADALLAVAYGPGPADHNGPSDLIHGTAPRYDLGLLELMFTVIVAFCFVLTWRKKVPTGTYVAVVSLAYAPVRFAMDFLRITDGEGADPRYGGLTPAQWQCLALFVFGLYIAMLVRSLRKRGIDPMDEMLAPPAEPTEEHALAT